MTRVIFGSASQADVNKTHWIGLFIEQCGAQFRPIQGLWLLAGQACLALLHVTSELVTTHAVMTSSQYPDTRAHDGIIAAPAIMWWPVPTAQAITGGCSHSNQLWTAANMIMITRGGRSITDSCLCSNLCRWWPDFFVFTPWDSKLAKTNPNYSHPFVPSARCLSLPNLKVGPGPGGARDVSSGPARPACQPRARKFNF